MIKIVLAPVTFGDRHSWPSCPAPPVRSRWVHPLGVLALYLAVVVALPDYIRDRIGRRTWLLAHQLVALSYAGALWHSRALGSDVRMQGFGRTPTWVLQIPLLVLIALRLFRPRRPADQLSARLRRGRYQGSRHASLRAAIAVGLIGAGGPILMVALLAGLAAGHVGG